MSLKGWLYHVRRCLAAQIFGHSVPEKIKIAHVSLVVSELNSKLTQKAAGGLYELVRYAI